MRGKRAPTSDG
jgi:hypothetical protein